MTKSITDILYDRSVDGLFYLSHMTGFTYREINVIVFCIVEPLLYLALFIVILRLRRELAKQRI